MKKKTNNTKDIDVVIGVKTNTYKKTSDEQHS